MPRKLSLKTIQAQILALEAKAEKLKNADKPGIKELRSVIAQFKLRPADIKLALKKAGTKLTARGIVTGTKLKPKYQNPKNKDETWAGRGLKPKWLSAMIKQGKKLEEFAL
jgi:DNA-binding protein H-NS